MRKEIVDNDPLGLAHEAAKMINIQAPRTPAPQVSEEQHASSTR